MVKDNISDFIISLKNAGIAGKSVVVFPQSKLIVAIAELLTKEGYLKSVEKKVRKGERIVEVVLNYKEDGGPKITGVRRISKLSRRVYEKSRNLRYSKTVLSHAIMSTPKGVMTDKSAKKLGVGGEILFKIW